MFKKTASSAFKMLRILHFCSISHSEFAMAKSDIISLLAQCLPILQPLNQRQPIKSNKNSCRASYSRQTQGIEYLKLIEHFRPINELQTVGQNSFWFCFQNETNLHMNMMFVGLHTAGLAFHLHKSVCLHQLIITSSSQSGVI